MDPLDYIKVEENSAFISITAFLPFPESYEYQKDENGKLKTQTLTFVPGAFFMVSEQEGYAEVWIELYPDAIHRGIDSLRMCLTPYKKKELEEIISCAKDFIKQHHIEEIRSLLEHKNAPLSRFHWMEIS